ncbi:MAG: heparinase II/III-family protein [Treponema sp.]|nr:heparinase II/III-family protein [Treponema sp.]
MVRKYLNLLPENCADFIPCPKAGDRKAWMSLPEAVTAPFVAAAEERLSQEYPGISAALYMEFTKNGNRSHFEAAYFTRRIMLNLFVLAECITYEGRFLNAIADGVIALCEESGWQLPAHNSYRRNEPQRAFPDSANPVLDLFACETGAQLAFVQYVLGAELDRISPEFCARIRREFDFRIIKPYLKKHFWWMGYNSEPTNNWTVWCTQNVLLGAFLPGMTEDAERRKCLNRAVFSIDRFLAGYGDDGCCDEGALYYRHAGLCLFNALEVLSAVSGGVFDSVFSEPKIRNIAEYIVNVHGGGDYYLNFADCAAAAGRAGVREFLFGKRCASERLMTFAAADWSKTVSEASVTGKLHRYDSSDEMLNLFYLVEELFVTSEVLSYHASHQTVPKQPDWVYKSTGLHIFRDSVFCLGVKAGGNGDSHNHNDTGSFILYKHSRPFIIDVGVETYSKKTFSSQRYEIWTMQSQFHNVTDFATGAQLAGAEYKARKVHAAIEEQAASVSMELKDAYAPSAGLVSYKRTVTLLRERDVVVQDQLASYPGLAFFTLMTQAEPVVSFEEGTGTVITVGDVGTVLVPELHPLSVYIEPISITDGRLLQSWQSPVYRIRISYRNTLKVIFR